MQTCLAPLEEGAVACLNNIQATDELDDDDNKYRKRQRGTRHRLVVLFVMAFVFLLVLLGGIFFIEETNDNKKKKRSRITPLHQAPSDEEETHQALRKLVQAYVKVQLEDNPHAHLETIRRDTFSTVGRLFEEVNKESWYKTLVNEAVVEAVASLADASSQHDSTAPRIDNILEQQLQTLQNIVDDKDCQVPEIDVTDPNYEANQAQEVFQKCKLLILRNVVNVTTLRERVIPNVKDYILGLESNRTSREGITTNGEGNFWAIRDYNRWEILLPRNVIEDEILMHPDILKVLGSPQILEGDQLTLHSAGVNLAGPGSPLQDWHQDERFLFGDASLSDTKLAGHDVPSYAVTVSVPLLDVTARHGPTTFCMGSSVLHGMTDVWEKSPTELASEYKVHDRHKSLLFNKSSAYSKYYKSGYDNCPREFRQAPELNLGDVSLFDYTLKHRGGANTHKEESRAIMFYTYSRYWFKDSNFRQNDAPEEEASDEEKFKFQLTAATRFALPSSSRPCQGDECQREEQIDIKHLMLSQLFQ